MKPELRSALKDAVLKLNPGEMARNPVMFVTYVGAAVTTVIALKNGLRGEISAFEIQVVLWLWFTVLFANFAEALAEGRGKAQAASLRKSKVDVMARKIEGKSQVRVSAGLLKVGDRVVCETGDIIPSDGEVIEGIASVDESAITGESAPVIRESGGDRSAVTGGTRVLSDRIVIRITADPGSTFVDRLIALIEGAKRQKTPNEIALSIVLSGLTLVFIFVVAALKVYADYSAAQSHQILSQVVSVGSLVALLVCLIPTTIGGLLSAIGIAGMDRMIRKNIIATSGRAVEAAGDIDVLLLDKTGTITLGNRIAAQFIPAPGVDPADLAKAAQLSSFADETPEGRSIVVLAKEQFGLRGETVLPSEAHFVPFSATSRMSGVDLLGEDGGVRCRIRKGAIEAIEEHLKSWLANFPNELRQKIAEISKAGGTPLAVARDADVLGLIYLKDIVKGGLKERFAEFRRMGIRTIMITGDNPLTAAAIAAEAGVDDFIAQATPESKLKKIRDEQAAGHLVGMTGDGTNDAPALAQADVGMTMNSGTQAAREAGNMVDLDSNPTKLIEVVETGKQLLVTRGALTTFSIANDVAKYFAILPALFATLYNSGTVDGPLARFNIMHLQSPQSAILSAVIFNAVIIILLIPIALRGVRYRAANANALLSRNLLIYGLGGLIAPFIGIKAIDLLIAGLGGLR